MFCQNPNSKANRDLTILDIPFRVEETDGIVRALGTELPRYHPNRMEFEGEFETLYFLGVAVKNWQCAEWWGQQEVQYDHSLRLFIGDRVGRILLKFSDGSHELIPLLFGINVFNYNLFCKPLAIEGEMNSYNAPYDEPFRSDPAARVLLDNCLILHENPAPDAQKMTKWVFAYKPRRGRHMVAIEWIRDEAKIADFVFSAVTGVPTGEADTTGLQAVDESFFLGKQYFPAAEALRRRLYQYKDELPSSVPLWEIDGFDAPDIRFYNPDGLDMLTNVYRQNIMDMAYQKISDDGMTHTSSPNAYDFGCYIGFGTFAPSGHYAEHIWTRDIGRMLVETISAGYFDRSRLAVDRLHKCLYYPSIRHPFPHWKRIANLPVLGEADLHNDGLENDGHASVMEAVYTLWRKGAVDRNWLIAHKQELIDAADNYFYQIEHADACSYNGMFYTYSETSTQQGGGYDLYSNIISGIALEMYAVLFREMGEADYACRCAETAARTYATATATFTMPHPRFGNVLTDTTDDCWTYEYKRFAPLILQSDFRTLDVFRDAPTLFDLMSRTFEAERALYYNPYSGRQMGYGQGYLTETVLSLDLPQAYTDCVNAAAHLCYHHTDIPYTVPEGVIMHGDGAFWYRNSDQGNAVQQAEIVKCIRLVCGVDDLDRGRIWRLIPRLPLTMSYMTVDKLPVVSPDGTVSHVTYEYGRGMGAVTVSCGTESYYLNLTAEAAPAYVRFGPFTGTGEFTVSGGHICDIATVNGYRYVYVALNQ